jgi:hypothetical protein
LKDFLTASEEKLKRNQCPSFIDLLPGKMLRSYLSSSSFLYIMYGAINAQMHLPSLLKRSLLKCIHCESFLSFSVRQLKKILESSCKFAESTINIKKIAIELISFKAFRKCQLLAIPTGRKNSFYLKYDKKIMGLSYNVP